jgi:hypothetical protein
MSSTPVPDTENTPLVIYAVELHAFRNGNRLPREFRLGCGKIFHEIGEDELQVLPLLGRVLVNKTLMFGPKRGCRPDAGES